MLAVAAALVVVVIVIWSEHAPRTSLLILLAVLIPAPIVVRVLQRRFDPFEPILIMAVSLLVMFLLRPIAHLFYGKMIYDGRSLEPGFNTALLIGAVGVAALYCGYFMPMARTLARRIPSLPNALRPDAAIIFAASLVLIGLLLYASYVQQIGGLDIAKRFLARRDSQTDLLSLNVTVYFLWGPFLAIPATLLLLEAAARQRRALVVTLCAAVTGLGIVTITGPRGDRAWLMLLALGVFMLPYLRAQKRPKTRNLAIVALLGFAFGITFLADVRQSTRTTSSGELFSRTLKNPVRGWDEFIMGADTEMFSVVASMVQRVPSSQPHEPGITAASLATNWIPRAFYPNKPLNADEKIFHMLRPTQATYTRAGPAPSLFAGFYYDSGFLGVVIGSILVGGVLRLLFEYLLANPRGVGVRLLYASALPLVVLLMRGNPTDTVARMTYVVIPILVALWLTGERQRWDYRRASPSASASISRQSSH